ncbi:molybdopterin molybdenumtransferase MoeA [Campylobacter sp. MIT 99-7217]|uniref:molybdopterin molybdotransferase MoeA n=1 Tax=Campylobacter sp. MIT 99-7217 TaxID=535091 RepID=UPI00115A1ABF|nr:molybdopterin molybdotransferase MoeA [Campylobacter sp. MIT 99-7217]TQR32966.1 molybdopterin molybdenumtransferase MoeA [Campylobacter sp. MIT 99-7217]
MKDIFETLKELETKIDPLKGYELVSLENANKRILAEDIRALRASPSFDNSALDGYAFSYADKNEALSVKETIFAGDKRSLTLGKNEAFKIMTGAMIPKNADTILPLEDEKFQDEKLLINADIKQFNAIRLRGEEFKEGEILFKKAECLNPAKIALLASQGIYKIKLAKRLNIGIFSSGNELYEPWQHADEFSIYNANAQALNALLSSENVSYLGIIKDEFELVKQGFEDNQFNLLISSGGASVGEADFMEKALLELGFGAVFRGVKAKFVKPTKLYKKGEKLVLLCPGNPMSAFLSCFIFARKLLNLLRGNFSEGLKFKAILKDDLKLKSGRNNLILGNLQDNFFIPFNEGKYSSAMLTPLAQSAFLFISDKEINEYKAGDEISIFYLNA